MQGHCYLNDVFSQTAIVFKEKGAGEVGASDQGENPVLER